MAIEEAPTLAQAAQLLQVGTRTLYRWLQHPELSKKERQPMKSRELRGAINRAKFVYALCQYSITHTYHVKVSKEAARELVDVADEEKQEITASMDAGDLYIGMISERESAALATGEETDDDE